MLQRPFGPVESTRADGIRVVRDLPYGRRPAQRLDLYRGAGGGDRRPVLVVVHGGGWTIGDKAHPQVVGNKVAHWVPRGWIVVSVNYRTLPVAGPLEQAADVAQALAAVRRHVGRWGGDGERMVLIAHSSGAHLGALVLADGEARAGLRGAVLLDCAALDVVDVMQGPHPPLHARVFGVDPAGWREASPWHRLEAPTVPLLLVCSAQRPVAQAQAERYAERARALGGSARVVQTALAHAEINDRLGSDAALTAAIDDFLASLELGPQGETPQRPRDANSRIASGPPKLE